VLASLAAAVATVGGVLRMCGGGAEVGWRQTAEALLMTLPPAPPAGWAHAHGLRIDGVGLVDSPDAGPCPTGTFCQAGSRIGTDCPLGSFCPPGATAPTPCDVGRCAPGARQPPGPA
jgi:hypothetical protein